MYTALTVLHVIVCIFLILVVLLQAGKGGGMGIGFGGGGSQTVFGSSGAGNFLTRLTAVAAGVFFLNSLLLAYLSSQSDSRRLQGLAQRKAAEKQAQQAASAKLAKDLEQARKEIESKSGGAGEPGTSTPEATESTVPPTETAPSGSTAPPGGGGAAPASTSEPEPAPPTAPGPAPRPASRPRKTTAPPPPAAPAAEPPAAPAPAPAEPAPPATP